MDQDNIFKKSQSHADIQRSFPINIEFKRPQPSSTMNRTRKQLDFDYSKNISKENNIRQKHINDSDQNYSTTSSSSCSRNNNVNVLLKCLNIMNLQNKNVMQENEIIRKELQSKQIKILDLQRENLEIKIASQPNDFNHQYKEIQQLSGFQKQNILNFKDSCHKCQFLNEFQDNSIFSQQSDIHIPLQYDTNYKHYQQIKKEDEQTKIQSLSDLYKLKQFNLEDNIVKDQKEDQSQLINDIQKKQYSNNNLLNIHPENIRIQSDKVEEKQSYSQYYNFKRQSNTLQKIQNNNYSQTPSHSSQEQQQLFLHSTINSACSSSRLNNQNFSNQFNNDQGNTISILSPQNITYLKNNKMIRPQSLNINENQGKISQNQYIQQEMQEKKHIKRSRNMSYKSLQEDFESIKSNLMILNQMRSMHKPPFQNQIDNHNSHEMEIKKQEDYLNMNSHTLQYQDKNQKQEKKQINFSQQLQQQTSTSCLSMSNTEKQFTKQTTDNIIQFTKENCQQIYEIDENIQNNEIQSLQNINRVTSQCTPTRISSHSNSIIQSNLSYKNYKVQSEPRPNQIPQSHIHPYSQQNRKSQYKTIETTAQQNWLVQNYQIGDQNYNNHQRNNSIKSQFENSQYYKNPLYDQYL